MLVTAKIIVREVGSTDKWRMQDFPSMRSAEAYAISEVLGDIDRNPNVAYEIVEKDDSGNEQVLKTYTMQDVLPFVQEREKNIARPKDEIYWQMRTPRTPSGRPSSLPEDRKIQQYFPGDIVEVDPGDYETDWHRLKSEDAPAGTYGSSMNYAKADAYLMKGRDPAHEIRKIANNTWLIRRDDDKIALRLHSTDIATFNKDGTYVVSMDGWNTVTTKARLREYTNSNISSNRGDLYINGVPFSSRDQVKLAGDGTVLAIKKRDDIQWMPVQKQPDDEDKIRHSRGGEIAEIAYLDDKRSKKGWQGLVYAVIFLSDGEKGFIPQSMLAPVQVKGEVNEGDEIVMARRNPFHVYAQELKNDTFSNETEAPSATQKDEGRTLEDIDRTQNNKNVIPGPWDGTKRHAINPFYSRAQTDHETAETGHIGSGDDSLKIGDGKRTPGNTSEPLYPSMHETNQTSTHKQL
jgi:hypothetical protein